MITELQELIIQKYLNNHNILTIIEISENLNDINKLCNYHILISHIIYITIELKFNQENNPHNYKTLNGRELHEYIQKLPNKSKTANNTQKHPKCQKFSPRDLPKLAKTD